MKQRTRWPALVAFAALLLVACADDTSQSWDGEATRSTGSFANGNVDGAGTTTSSVAGSTGQGSGSITAPTGGTAVTTGVTTGGTAGVFDAGPSGTTGTPGADAASGSLDASQMPEGGPKTDGSTDGAAPADATLTPQEPHTFVGNITTRGQVRSDFIDYWDQITPENEGKWGSVEPSRDQMNWGPLDAAYDYAKQHGIPFKQHTFVWGSQEPRWVAGLSPQEQREEVEEWIRLYCERYPDTQMIDVVNEPPPHTTPSYANAIGGAGASGWDWIVQSFEWARQYCPNAILILNDYNTVEYPNDNAHFIDITRRVLAAGAPVDAVGVQAHDAHKLPTDRVRMYIDKIADETGLPIYVSEYDISEGNDEEQRRIMASQFEMFWHHEDVVGITLWGYVQGATWLPNTGLLSEAGEPRPAMTWLMDFLEQQR